MKLGMRFCPSIRVFLFLLTSTDGYDVTTPIVVTNADEFTIKTVAEGAVVPGAALRKLEANK